MTSCVIGQMMRYLFMTCNKQCDWSDDISVTCYNLHDWEVDIFVSCDTLCDWADDTFVTCNKQCDWSDDISVTCDKIYDWAVLTVSIGVSPGARTHCRLMALPPHPRRPLQNIIKHKLYTGTPLCLLVYLLA